MQQTGLARKRNQATLPNVPSFSSNGTKKQKTTGLLGQSVLAKSSLATALQASRRPNTKSRTSFLRTGSTGGGNDVAASFQKNVAFKNVIFQSSESRSNMSSSRGLGAKSVEPLKANSRTAKSMQGGSSLWSKAMIPNGFRRT
jgi:hypothetical protein